MASGFSPKHVHQGLPLDNLTPEQFLVIAIETVKRLDWNIGYTETGFIAYTKFSMNSWSEEVKVKISNDTVNLKSECTGSQMEDWGKNKRNIENFTSTFSELKTTLTADEIS